MQIDNKFIGIGVIALGAVIAGAYVTGTKQGGEANAAVAQSVSGPAAMPVSAAANLADQAALPNGHPTAAGQPAHSGKVEGYDPKARFTHFRVGNRNVKDILLDGKVLWVGTSGGLIRYDTSNDSYRLFDSSNGLLSNGVFHVSRLDGRIVAGTYGGGMAMYDEAKDNWETYNIPEGLGDAFVYDVLKATNGDVWVATWSGVNRIRGGALKDRSKWDLYTVENTRTGLPNDWVYGLAEGKNGDIWLATEGGLALFRNGKWQNWNHQKGLGAPYDVVKNDIQFKNDPAQYSKHHAKQKEEMGLQGVQTAYNPNYIVSLIVDRAGIVWAGTWGGGLSRFDGKNWKIYTVKDGLPGNHIFMLHQDAHGKLWVGTNNGLASMEGEKFSNLGTGDGLFSNYVFSMASSADGHRWVGSFGGVAHLAPVK
jgi:ligand-binding sensor domain-containing protein